MKSSAPMPIKAFASLMLAAVMVAIGMTISYAQEQRGIASVYTTKTGVKTASGKRLNDHALTAAHRTLPFGTKVKVTNRYNGKSVIVIITDRGPWVKNRVIDLTLAAAHAIGMGFGLVPVVLQRQ